MILLFSILIPTSALFFAGFCFLVRKESLQQIHTLHHSSFPRSLPMPGSPRPTSPPPSRWRIPVAWFFYCVAAVFAFNFWTSPHFPLWYVAWAIGLAFRGNYRRTRQDPENQRKWSLILLIGFFFILLFIFEAFLKTTLGLAVLAASLACFVGYAFIQDLKLYRSLR